MTKEIIDGTKMLRLCLGIVISVLKELINLLNAKNICMLSCESA